MDSLVTKTIILNEGDPRTKREEIRTYFHKTWEIDEQLYKAVKSEDSFYLRADPLRHPLIFYIGHTAAFYINKLILGKVIYRRINPEYESMFAVGVDEMSWDDLNDKHYNWPSLPKVMSYRREVRKLIDRIICELELNLPISWESPFWLIMMGIEHQRIHLETSSVLIRQLPLDKVQDNALSIICRHDPPPPDNELISVKGRIVKMGKPLDHPLYGWDNEYGTHEYEVDDFKAGKYLVSNQEFLQFVKAGGYKDRQWWTDEGWSWKNFVKAEHPKFWILRDDKWYLRLVTEEISLPWSFPVEINYLEAKAFCHWKTGKTGQPFRLPTEDEWQILYENAELKDQPWWDKACGNINLEHYASPCPVNEFSFREFHDIIGNVWQWTETPFSGFKGFKIHPCYDDFSTPTFDGRHNLIKGGSWISTGNEATRHSRYAFRRHFFQHAGFRYVVSEQALPETGDFYEDDPEIITSCEQDYGEDYLGLGNYPSRLVDLCKPWIQKQEKALIIGCNAGRSSFELAKYFERVTGIDFTARLIKVAEKMKSGNKIRYQVPIEGELMALREVTLDELNLSGSPEKVEFWQADASNLAAKFKDYDFVLSQNVLEYIYDPDNFLKIIQRRINTGGILVIASSYDWDNEIIKKGKQLGGYRRDGEPYFSINALHNILDENFTEIKSPADLPFIIRQNARNFLYKIAQISFWQKKSTTLKITG